MTEQKPDDFVESGPFCRHWHDPAECDERCAHCGHTCSQHDQCERGDCNVKGCTCEGWAGYPDGYIPVN